jgi:hypothetical protein
MLRSSKKSKYCVHHQRKLRHIDEVEDATLDLFQPISSGFVPATGLAKSLSRLFACVAEGRINAKDAVAMSRIAETLLKTIPLSTKEFRDCYLYRYWAQLIRRSFGELPEYIPPESEEDDSDDSDDSSDDNSEDSRNSGEEAPKDTGCSGDDVSTSVRSTSSS